MLEFDENNQASTPASSARQDSKRPDSRTRHRGLTLLRKILNDFHNSLDLKINEAEYEQLSSEENAESVAPGKIPDGSSLDNDPVDDNLLNQTSERLIKDGEDEKAGNTPLLVPD